MQNLTFIAENKEQQLAFLKRLVLQNSYTNDKAGVDKCGEFIIKELSSPNISMMRYPQQQLGDHLVFSSSAVRKSNLSPILLLGHMDTVFPPDSDFDWFKDDDQNLYGPGVIDMKGGLATAVYAIKSLDHCGLLSEIPLIFICNSDEETGSISSTEIIKKFAKKSACGLVFECGGLTGELVTGRKGKTGYTIEITGAAGHAAFASIGKRSAIHELAHKIISFEKLNDTEKKLVVNVGVIEGGVGPNSIAANAWAKIDTRYLTAEDGIQNKKDIEQISAKSSVKGTQAQCLITSNRPPMEQSSGNQQLYRHIGDEAEKLNLEVSEELRSGVSDANSLAACGLAVVDGMGPIGDCDHSSKEYMIKSSLEEKTTLTSAVLVSLWKKHKNGGIFT